MQPKIKLLKMSLIDPPDIAMRAQISDEELAGLAASIRQVGLINPISVTAENGRFRIHAGHRRYLAFQNLGRDEIQCKDYTGCDVSPEFIKVHENLHRTDVTDGEMVVYLGDVEEKYNYTLEQLCQLCGKSEAWVNTRMAIYRGDKEVFTALLAGQLNLGQATALNRFPDDFRHAYLLQVIDSNAPIKYIEQWLQQAKLLVASQQPGVPVTHVVPVQALPGIAPTCACELCKSTQAPWELIQVTVHKECIKSIVKQLENGGG